MAPKTVGFVVADSERLQNPFHDSGKRRCPSRPDDQVKVVARRKTNFSWALASTSRNICFTTCSNRSFWWLARAVTWCFAPSWTIRALLIPYITWCLGVLLLIGGLSPGGFTCSPDSRSPGRLAPPGRGRRPSGGPRVNTRKTGDQGRTTRKPKSLLRAYG